MNTNNTTYASPDAGHRLLELDSLRGLAALTVVSDHLLNEVSILRADTSIATSHWVVNLLKHTPLLGLWHGSAAVSFFFVLSGLVLARPFVQGRAMPYKTFLVRRVFRIYVPYAILLAFAISATAWVAQPESLGAWLSERWVGIAAHYSLVGYFNASTYDMPIWSLVHEMRISLIFPLLLFALRLRWVVSLGLATVIYFVAGQLRHAWGYDQDNTALIVTGQVLLPFVTGILLAGHWEPLVARVKALSSVQRMLALAAGFLAYTYSGWSQVLPSVLQKYYFNDGLVFLGCSAIILLAVSSPRLSRFLKRRPLVFSGQISYSLYLLHVPVMLVAAHALMPGSGRAVYWLITLVSAVVLATLSYHVLEKPVHDLGRRLTTRRAPSAVPTETAQAA